MGLCFSSSQQSSWLLAIEKLFKRSYVTQKPLFHWFSAGIGLELQQPWVWAPRGLCMQWPTVRAFPPKERGTSAPPAAVLHHHGDTNGPTRAASRTACPWTAEQRVLQEDPQGCCQQGVHSLKGMELQHCRFAPLSSFIKPKKLSSEARNWVKLYDHGQKFDQTVYLSTLGSVLEALMHSFIDKILNMSSWQVPQNAAGNLNVLEIKAREALTLKALLC